MDALKRAEEEKRRLSASPTVQEVDAVDESGATPPRIPVTDFIDDRSEDPTVEASTQQRTAEFSLEPMDSDVKPGDAQPEATMNTSQLSATAPGMAREAEQEFLREEEGAGLSGALAPNAAREWDSTRPSQRPRSGQPGNPTKPNLDATQAGARTRSSEFDFGDISTRVAADTVFAAGRSGQGASLLRVGGLALASVLAALAGIGLYLELNIPGPVALSPQATLPATAPIPTLSVAQQHPEQLPAATPPPVKSKVDVNAVTVATIVPMARTPALSPVPTLVPVATEVPKLANTAMASQLPDQPSLNATPLPTDDLPPAQKTPRSGLVTRDLVPTAEPFYRTDVGQFHIARGKNTASLAALIEEGYSAFRIGSFARAEYLYQSAIAQAPESRDALLGLAAINLQRGASERAYRYYRQVLDLYPRDPVATAALFSLGSQESQDLSEARLQALKAEQSRVPEVQFSLGNALAKRDRWSEAQQAYFEAYSQDNRNADYAFNLAVSLDRLGQGKPALDYYRKAVDLAHVRPGQFDVSRALARAQVLHQIVGEN